MHCIDKLRPRRGTLVPAGALALLLAACNGLLPENRTVASPPSGSAPLPSAPAPASVSIALSPAPVPSASQPGSPSLRAVPAGPPSPPPPPAAAAPAAPTKPSSALTKPSTASASSASPEAALPHAQRRFRSLGPPTAARNWDEFRQQAARRLVQSNPDGTYTGEVPEPLLAIPVLEVELNGDGSVRRVHILRQPKQARDTTQMAIEAVHRAAPYGAMARLPQPWKWAEVFLFDNDRRFKPRELDK